MCELFIEADKGLWESQSKSLRINGMATSLRLEGFFWNILGEIAKRDGMTVNQLISKLYDELTQEGDSLDNFTSFLRVCCGRYLHLQVLGDIPVNNEVSISSLNAKDILRRENNRLYQ